MKFTLEEKKTMWWHCVIELKSCRLISKVVNHDPTTIAHHLRRMGLRMRTIKEAKT